MSFDGWWRAGSNSAAFSLSDLLTLSLTIFAFCFGVTAKAASLNMMLPFRKCCTAVGLLPPWSSVLGFWVIVLLGANMSGCWCHWQPSSLSASTMFPNQALKIPFLVPWQVPPTLIAFWLIVSIVSCFNGPSFLFCSLSNSIAVLFWLMLQKRSSKLCWPCMPC